jgi:hypothetical protein
MKGYKMIKGIRFFVAAICAVFVSLPISYGADPLVAGQKALYEGTKNNLMRSAEKRCAVSASWGDT